MIVAEEEKGNSVCRKNEVLKTLKDAKEIAGFVFSGKQKEICDECKIKWLSEERE